MADSGEGLSEIGSFNSASAREALAQLYGAGAGALVVTNGLKDLRLSLVGSEVVLESVGFKPGENADLVREFLCALFWEDPSFVLEVDRSPEPKAGVHRLSLSPPDLKSLVSEMGQGCAELGQLHEQVPGLDTIVTVKGEPPPPEVRDPSADLYRALEGQSQGVLLSAAQEAGLDAIDAAWAALDLVEADQATIRRAPPTLALKRYRRAEQLIERGFLRGLRYSHLARGYERLEPKRVAMLHRLAGEGYLAEERGALAINSLRSCLAHNPEDVATLETLIVAHEEIHELDEARRLRREMVTLYLTWDMPARARYHLEVVADPAPAQKEVLFRCCLRMRDFNAAAELAARRLPNMSPQERAGLAKRFAEAGASGRPLQRAVALSGVRRLQPLRRVLWLLALVAFLGCGLVGAELVFRLRFRQARLATTADLEAGRFDAASSHWGELEALAGKLGAADWPLTCLAKVDEVLSGLAAVEQDAALLQTAAARQVLDWKAQGDSQVAFEKLEAFKSEPQSRALDQLIGDKLAEVTTYRAEVQEKAENLRQLVDALLRDKALVQAQELARDHQDASDLWRGLSLPVVVQVRPRQATLYRGGLVIDPLNEEEGTWEISLPLDGEEIAVRATAPRCVPRELTLRFDDELDTVEFSLKLVGLFPIAYEESPSGPEGEGLFVVEDQRIVSSFGQLRGLTVEPEDDSELLSSISSTLRPGERLVVLLRSEIQGQRLLLSSVDLFLVPPDGKLRRPRRVVPDPQRGAITRRARKEDGVLKVEGLSRFDDIPELLRVIGLGLAQMREESPR